MELLSVDADGGVPVQFRCADRRRSPRDAYRSLAIPEHRPATALEETRQRHDAFPVLTRVAQENVSHGLGP